VANGLLFERANALCVIEDCPRLVNAAGLRLAEMRSKRMNAESELKVCLASARLGIRELATAQGLKMTEQQIEDKAQTDDLVAVARLRLNIAELAADKAAANLEGYRLKGSVVNTWVLMLDKKS